MEENTALMEIGQAEQALQRADDIGEILVLRDKSAAIQIFANAQGFKEAAQKAKIFQLKAERKAGGWCADNVGNPGQFQPIDGNDMMGLPECVTAKESSRWQREAALPEEKFNEWIDESLAKGWEISASGLRREAEHFAHDQRRAEGTPELPDGKYNLIYADPPWEYDFSLSDSRRIDNQYPTMPTDEISALAIPGIVADDCVLFLWATSPKLIEALVVMSAWGFQYKTCMVWVKDKIGMGYYARQKHELLLIGTLGKPIVPEPENRPESVIVAPRTEHSRKPECVYTILEAMYPNATKIELFARNQREGWERWGNET